MRWNVSELMQSNLGEEREYEFSEECPEIQELASPAVEGTTQFTRTKAGILVMASVDTDIRCTCSRCLVEFAHPAHLAIQEEFLPTPDVATGIKVPVDESESDGAFTITPQHELDLTEPVRQYAILAMPMKPLCTEDCRGLCPTCGKNLNKGACGCKPVAKDSPWSALEGIRTQVRKSEKRK